MTRTKSVKITKIDAGQTTWGTDLVVDEAPLSIRINGHKYATLMCTPAAIEYLVLGYLLASGVIHALDDVSNIEIDESNLIAKVSLAVPFSPDAREKALTTGCGKGEIYLEVLQSCRRNETAMLVCAEDLLSLVSRFNKSSLLFQDTGGVHSGAICSTAEILLFHEDIGRHSAVDKLLGEALAKRLNLADKLLLTSGRLSSEILLKAAKQSIPIIVSRSAPTALAIELALRLNVTLVGFARGNRMNIYSGAGRIRA